MALLEIRQRTGWLFVALLVAHLVLISTQAKTGTGATVFRSVVFGAFAEVQRTTDGGVSAVKGTWEDYFALQKVRLENEALKKEVIDLRIAIQRESEAAAQSRTLQKMLKFRDELPFATTGARVIGGSASTEFRTITIDKGTDDGLKNDMAVVAPQGVVGRIIQPANRASQVQLLIDTDAAAGAIVEPSRAQGIIVGTKTGYRLEYVPTSATIKVGDRVVTSGTEGIFPEFSGGIDGEYPRGFVIGHIKSMQRGAGQFENVEVTPAVDFTSLEHVLVVLPSSPATPAKPAKSDAVSTTGRGNAGESRAR